MTDRVVLTLLFATMLTACGTVGTGTQVSTSRHVCDAGQITRAAFDIGSSGPGVRISCVEKAPAQYFNHFRIVKEIGEDERKIDFSVELEQPQDDCSKGVFKDFKELIKFANKFNPTDKRGAATAAFRKSPNGTTFITKLNQCFPEINARLVSQQFEGELEYRAVADRKELQISKLNSIPLVWGIGSTSVQFTLIDNSVPGGVPKFLVYDGKEGATLFFETITRSRSALASAQTTTYPISAVERDELVLGRKGIVEGLIPTYVLQQVANRRVYGIGNSHKYLQVPKTKVGETEYYPANAVQLSVAKFIGKDRAQIASLLPTGRYHEHTVSNLILVEGFLAGLGVTEVEIVEADLANGVLVYENW